MLAPVALAATGWGGAALWFRGWPLIAIGFGLAACLLLGLVLVGRAGAWPFLGLALLLGVLTLWWVGIAPRADRDWSPPLARQPGIVIDGARMTVTNVRDFRWRAAADGKGLGSGEEIAQERWETRSYDLTRLEGVDLFFSYWTGPDIAHLVVSFPFTDAVPLAFSIEIRRERGEAYSALAGFFKTYELAIVAADERDVIRLRTDVWKEDVRLYRLAVARESALRLLLAFARETNRLAEKPRWYHTITDNCVTVAFRIAREVWPDLALDRRILFPGRAPDYAYEIGALGRSDSLEALKAKAAISERARTLPDEGFSSGIREGLPKPSP